MRINKKKYKKFAEKGKIYRKIPIILLCLLGVIIFIPISLDLFLFPSCWLYEVGKTIFESREAMWTAITGIIAAIGLAVPITWQVLLQREKNIKFRRRLNLGLKHEIMNNFKLVFSGEVERVTDKHMLRLAYDRLDIIDDIDKLNGILFLYKESEYFERITRDWRKEDPGLITEKHANLCGEYINFFSEILFSKKSKNTVKLSIDELKQDTIKKFKNITPKVIKRLKEAGLIEEFEDQYKSIESSDKFKLIKRVLETEIYSEYRSKLIDFYDVWEKRIDKAIIKYVNRIISRK